MIKIKLFSFLIFLAVLLSCSSTTDQNVMGLPVLVKEGFISNNEYEIVCMGYPKEGLTGPQREESAKRAAILNAYYFSNERFGAFVSPDKDGRIANMTVRDEYCELRYIIKKDNLKNLKKANDSRKAEEAKKADEAKKLEEARKAEEAKKADEPKEIDEATKE